MHFVVIGGNGFIGRHFVSAAVSKGHRVTIVGRAASIADEHGPAVDYRSGGTQALAADSELLSRADRICHFATTSTPATSNADPLADIESNLMSTVRLLEAMRQTGNRRILFLSSGGAVYGRPHYLPIDEKHPLNPLSAYGVVKSAIERYLRMYEANYSLAPTIIRLANPYGPGQNSFGQLGAVSTFIHLALTDQPATIWGDGSVIRDYVYISDATALLLAAAESDATGTFNCGAGTGTSLIELMETVEQATGKTLHRQFKPARSFDPPEVVLDVSLAHSIFGWRPAVPLTAGVSRTVKALAD
ncbi:NAD-dependent epimerase/dehydratase family protein [Devosia sp.]|uniref:NAD-dependent epimerase/dehydratase family protein n=1 Tax=Devosia sp. TaxID=1871048 RepID=UPI001AC80D3F|nr:NAD-dependent epimerase/dehydratase family protein [Devosia sp.]MBN9332125.1 NAD-dependent epimerase/dehydratase family protein [Devosia sp.]